MAPRWNREGDDGAEREGDDGDGGDGGDGRGWCE